MSLMLVGPGAQQEEMDYVERAQDYKANEQYMDHGIGEVSSRES